MLTPENLREWADALDNHDSGLDLSWLVGELRMAADELEADVIDNSSPGHLRDVPQLPPGLYTYGMVPRFASTSRWRVDGWNRPWYILGPASVLLGAETVIVERLDLPSTEVQPLDVVGWRRVKKKGKGTVLFVLMTFERIVMEDRPQPEEQ